MGPTLIIIKTSEGAICGGFTSKSWDNIGQSYEVYDGLAFVFNMTQKFKCNVWQKAITRCNNGFCFGQNILAFNSYPELNSKNSGMCKIDKNGGYDGIEGDVSPLTNQKDTFTISQLEVYKIFY